MLFWYVSLCFFANREALATLCEYAGLSEPPMVTIGTGGLDEPEYPQSVTIASLFASIKYGS